MNLFYPLATLLYCCRLASSDRLKFRKFYDPVHDQIGSYEFLCRSLKTKSREERRDTVAYLNIPRNWFLLLGIPKCRKHLPFHMDLMFYNEFTLMEFLRIGEPVWETLINFRFGSRFSVIVRGMVEKSILQVSDVLVEFIFYSLKYYKDDCFLPRLLTRMGLEERNMYLSELERRFNQGIVTELTGFEDYLQFFRVATKIGIIAIESYDQMIGSLFSVLSNAKPFKFNFIMESFKFPFKFTIQQRYKQDFHNIIYTSQVEGRDEISFHQMKVSKILPRPHMNPISLELRLSEFVLDYSIINILVRKVKQCTVVGTVRLEKLTLSDKDLKIEIARIFWPFYRLAKMRHYVDADEYLKRGAYSDILHDRMHIIRDALRTFIPDPQDEKLQSIERKKYLEEYSLLLSFDGDLVKIEKWTKSQDMSKRLALWFQEKDTHQFIMTFGHSLINNGLTIVNLVEMGDSIWPYLRDLNLIKVLRARLFHFTRINMASPNFQRLFMNHLDYFWYLLADSMLQADDETRLNCLQTLADNLRVGKFETDSSLRVYFNFFAKILKMGLISKESTIHFFKSIAKELEGPNTFHSNYIVKCLGGKAAAIRQDLVNEFEWEASGFEENLVMNIKIFLADSKTFRLDSSTPEIANDIESMDIYLTQAMKKGIAPIDINLVMPRILLDEKFTEYLLSFVLVGVFEEFKEKDASLSNVALKVLIHNFLEMCLIESLQSGTCLEARGYLEATLSYLDDFELANRLSDILWSVVPLEFHPLPV